MTARLVSPGASRYLTGAQRAGLAERDPAADVEGHDAAAKVMILSGLVGQGVLSDIIAVASRRAGCS